MRYIVLILLFAACNPVKKVLQSPAMFEVVKDSVIARGYCLNDTIFSHSSDTTYLHDTTTLVYVDTTTIRDSVYFWETKFQTITKTRTIRDSVKSVIVDSALVQVLRKQRDAALNREQVAIKDSKRLSNILKFGAAGALIFFLLLFKLK